MFSGIIEELGQVVKIQRRANVLYLEIQANKVIEDLKIGESLAVNGVCLTVVSLGANRVGFDLMPETTRLTNLGYLKVNHKLNLERSLKLGDRLSGHLVQGHIDCLGTIRRKAYINNNLSFQISISPDFMRYVIPKGSIAIDGISLTVAQKQANTFCVYIIPHTLKNTTLGTRRPSDKVNIEFDLLVKTSLQR